MPRYWSASALSELLPQPVVGVPLVTATSAPVSLQKLSELIDLTEGAVHGAIAAAGYAVPIASTSADAWNYIRGVVRDGAGYEALKMIPGGKASADEYRLAYRRAMEEIRSGEQTILAPHETGEGGRGLPRGGGPATYTVGWDWMP
jgi:hypothetical protein